MRTHCLAIVGISGAGKTTFSRRFESEHSGFKLISASSVIRELQLEARTLADWFEMQRAIACHVTALTNRLSDIILLDAHCSIEFGGKVLDVPISVFEEVGTKGFIVVNRPTLDIMRARADDALRARIQASEVDLKLLAEHEVNTAMSYAAQLRTPCFVVATYRDFERSIFSVLRAIAE